MARSPKSRFIPEQALTADQKKSCLASPALERRIEASGAAHSAFSSAPAHWMVRREVLRWQLLLLSGSGPVTHLGLRPVLNS